MNRGWALSGKLHGRLLDLTDLAALSTHLLTPSGRLSADIDLGGSVQQPTYSGSIRLEQGEVHLPDLGITPRLTINIERRPASETIDLYGKALSGPGRLALHGQYRLPTTAADAPHLGLEIVGEHFEFMHYPRLRLLLSPVLRIDHTPTELGIVGTVKIPQGQWTIAERRRQVVKVSPDQVIVGQPQATASHAPPAPAVFAEVDLILGNAVYFEGYGVLTRLTGGLHLSREAQGPTQAEGILDLVDGQYNAYGQELKIQEGRLLFQGPLARPVLKALAIRQIKRHQVIAGIDISGELGELHSELFSLPELPEPEVLSFLLTGEPLAARDSGDAFALIDAVAQLGVAGGEFITEQIADQFGLDVLRIEASDELEQAAVRIGKYLTPDLYIGYTKSLFDQASVLVLEYALSKHLTLEGESGQTQSMDLIYRIEH